MDTAAVAINQDRPSVAPTDLAAVKARQRVAWSSGDYAVVGTTLRSLARICARRSICALASASSMSPRATAMPASPPRVADAR
jgi:hypothetical protein